jgi:putative phosphoribosyl transferase
MHKFVDRHQAGKMLAEHLKAYAHRRDVLVLGLPRGGVPVAYEVAKALGVPLDVFMVRKLGFPGHEELAMGAIATGGAITFNQTMVDDLNVDKASIDQVIQLEQAELSRREQLYRGKRSCPDFSDKTIILVDDGIATGATIRVAIKALRQYGPAALIIAVPAAADETCKQLEPLVEDLVCPLKPIDFYAVGYWYDDFSQTTDEEVINLLDLR